MVMHSIDKGFAAKPAPIVRTGVEGIIQAELAGLQEFVEVTPEPSAEVGRPTIDFLRFGEG